MAKKLWDKGKGINSRIEAFTVGKDRELDLLLAKYDVQGTVAHIQMLQSIGYLTQDDLDKLNPELEKISSMIEQGNFVIEDGIEDVHSQVEYMLTEQLGDLGKKIHTARSRNDQVLTDIKLFLRNEIDEILCNIVGLFNRLIDKSEETKDVLMPGYTHMQAAMPSSFGLWFGAFAEGLIDDVIQFNSARKVVNQNPLGSAAGYGSSIPVNRSLTTELLGFEEMSINVIHAHLGRGKAELITAFSMASVATTLNKLASDVCQFNSQNFGFLKLPDELTTGSSIMPHKKNPDVFELIRAKTNKLKALPNEIAMITGNLPSGYHRDFQLLKENLFPAIQDLKEMLSITEFAVSNLEVSKDILDDPRYKLIYSVEVVNELVASGTPFRDAYRIVGEQIEQGTFVVPSEIKHTHEGSIGNLMTDAIKQKMQTQLKS